MSKRIYYKIVKEDLTSLGLRKNPNIMTFPIGEWIKEKNPMYNDMDCGGIWVAKKLSGAKSLLKYLNKKAEKEGKSEFKKCRLFSAEIGEVLFSNSYRVKTNKVRLLDEISILKNKPKQK